MCHSLIDELLRGGKREAREVAIPHPPDLFVSGHSALKFHSAVLGRVVVTQGLAPGLSAGVS